MYQLVRKTLDIYLREGRILGLSEFPQELSPLLAKKDAVFVTLYYEGKVVASSGRISCLKENTLYECIDNALLALQDPRLTETIKNPENFSRIHIRTDRFTAEHRRVLQKIEDLDVTKEGLIFLSQNLGIMTVVLPHMVHIDQTPHQYFSLACKKAGIEEKNISPADYVLYGISTVEESDF